MNPDFWNERFAESDPVYGTEPNAFVASNASRFRTGMRVLCLGEGEGRNAVWLARRGLETTALDYAEVALARTRSLATQRGVEVSTVHADLSHWKAAPESVDAIVSVFVHLPPEPRRAMHREAWNALRPNGLFVAEYFSCDQLSFGTGGPKNESMLYTVEDLREDFDRSGAHIELLDQLETDLHEGRYHQGRASVIRIVVSRSA